ncbi:MAG: TetR/AcrR family transcriptional regulator [Luminiphilus sp.]|nr:TetR/AcrR family transcriptional regulator [Luminiphilus sp.]
MSSNLIKQAPESHRKAAAGRDEGDPRQLSGRQALSDPDLRTVIGLEEVTLKSRKARQMQERLLKSAAVVFSRKGYTATCIADITAAAGVAHGSFYRYFEHKDGVLQELLVGLYAELAQATRDASSAEDDDTPPSEGRLRGFNIRFFHEYASRRGLLRVAREAAASSVDGRFRDIWFLMRGRFIDRTKKLILRMQSYGMAMGLDAELTAEALGSTSEQMAYVLVGLPESVPDSDRLTAIGLACHEVWSRTLFPSADNALSETEDVL